MLPASFAAWVPVFMATPTSACASAGASLVPSPVIATSLPLACSSRISCIFVSGVASARKSSTPASARDRRRGERVVAGDHHRADAHGAEAGEALLDAALDDVLEVDDAEHARAVGDRERRAARLSAIVVAACSTSAGTLPAERRDVARDRVDRALADHAAVEVAAAHARLRRERDEARAASSRQRRGRAGRASPWPARRSSGPRASRRRGSRAGRRRRAPRRARRAPG